MHSCNSVQHICRRRRMYLLLEKQIKVYGPQGLCSDSSLRSSTSQGGVKPTTPRSLIEDVDRQRGHERYPVPTIRLSGTGNKDKLLD